MAASTTTGNFKVIGTRPIRHDGVDKVTGRAKYGADYAFPGMLHGKVLRSPHAHANIKSIKLDKALTLPGVKAIVTSKDLPQAANKIEQSGEMTINPMYLSMNILAHEKVLYDGHAIAAVAATSPHIAEEALRLIEVEYEVLPPVMTVDDATKPGAPILLQGPAQQGRGRQADQRRAALSVQARRRRSWIQGGGLRHRARIQHRDGPSGLHRAAQRGRHLQLRRTGDDLLLDPGRFRRALAERAGARDAGGTYQSGPGRNRWRLRRQNHHLPRTALGAAVEEDRRAGQAGHDALGSAARERPDLRLEDQSEDGRDQGRQTRRRGNLDGLRGRRFPRLAGRRGRDVHHRSVHHREFSDRRLRRRRQSAQDRGLSRAGRNQRGLRLRDDNRRAGREVRNRSDRLPAEERRQGRRRADRRPSVQAHRIDSDPRRRSRTVRTTNRN